MSKDTDIQWCDSTINPTMGCDGCELWNGSTKVCYAGELHNRYGGRNSGFAPTFEQVTKFPGRMAKAAAWSDLRGVDRLEKPWLNELPRLIFVSDMSDAMSANIDFEFLKREIIDVCESEKGRRHQWLWLTKRPSRMLDFHFWLAQMWPENLWVGTSITTQKSASRLNFLTDIPARIRFVSIEPQWEAIDLTDWMHKIHWGIGGGQSGADAKPYNLNWARQLILQFALHDVPYFQKQLGAKPINAHGTPVMLRDGHGGDWSEWQCDLRVRQFPNVAKTAEAT